MWIAGNDNLKLCDHLSEHVLQLINNPLMLPYIVRPTLIYDKEVTIVTVKF